VRLAEEGEAATEQLEGEEVLSCLALLEEMIPCSKNELTTHRNEVNDCKIQFDRTYFQSLRTTMRRKVVFTAKPTGLRKSSGSYLFFSYQESHCQALGLLLC
jgi:hypothetical protein